MRAHVLGSGAGGGVPQWNCACANCALVRARDPSVSARTQDSLAIAADGTRWLLVNASPDILGQVERFEPLWPRRARHTPIAAIALTNGDLDHVLGLFSLRESQPLRVLATRRVREGLVEHNAMMRTLARTPEQVTWLDLELGREILIDDAGLGVTPLPVAGKLPIHLASTLEPSPEDNVALRVRDLRTGSTAAIATAVGSFEGLEDVLRGASAVFFDGTFWSENELIEQGLGQARARDMAHLPVGGEHGSLGQLASCSARRRIFTHLNNTNPMLRAASPERLAVERAGWEVAFDGLEVEA